MTQEDLSTVLRAIGSFVGEETKPLRERIAALEAQVKSLEDGGIRYCGVHQRAMDYKRGDVVTYSGSMFCAVGNVKRGEIPGAPGSVNWQLAVKQGKAA